MLKFLDKLDPQLSCKGYLLLKGAEILSLQQLIFRDLSAANEKTAAP